MSDRKLRSGTRKDYNKMVDSVDVALQEENSDENSDGACANLNARKQQQQDGEGSNVVDDGAILNYLVGNVDDSGNEINEYSSGESDEELLQAERRLEAMKQQQKSLLKQSKRARIAQETKEIENL